MLHLGQYTDRTHFLVDPTSIRNVFDRVDFNGYRAFCDIVGVLPSKKGVTYFGELTDEDGVFIAFKANGEVKEFEEREEALKFLVDGENYE